MKKHRVWRAVSLIACWAQVIVTTIRLQRASLPPLKPRRSRARTTSHVSKSKLAFLATLKDSTIPSVDIPLWATFRLTTSKRYTPRKWLNYLCVKLGEYHTSTKHCGTLLLVRAFNPPSNAATRFGDPKGLLGIPDHAQSGMPRGVLGCLPLVRLGT